MRTAVWIVGGAGFIYGLHWWREWGLAQGLTGDRGASFFLQLAFVDLAVVLVHELGHTVTGLALGMKLRAFIAGPFQWRILDGKWRFNFRLASLFSSGGATALVPTDPRQSVWDRACMIAAGPFFSLASGVLALCAALAAPGQPWQPAWILLACLGLASVLVGLLNLIPFQTGTAYSDGAQLYQILSGGPWADYHRVLAVVGSTLVTPLRPRDYDIDAINRAALKFTHGKPAILLHLLASNYHLDREEFHKALFFFEQAERTYKSSGANDIPSGWYTVFTFRKAFLHHDALEARLWWERVNTEKTKRLNVDYWLAQSALLWAERSFSEARQALGKAEEAARQLPKFGAYEFDRHRCALLRKALDESSETLEQFQLSK